MPDKKLTDSEIAKAIEKCAIHKKCKNCMFEDESGCARKLLYLAYNLINRLQGENKAFAEIIKKQDDEISGLRKDLLSRKNLEESFSKSVKQFDKKLARTVELTKAEAYKECIENVKPIIREIVDLMFDDNASKCRIDKCRYTSNVACGNEVCLTENRAFWNSKLDNLLKELVGEDK